MQIPLSRLRHIPLLSTLTAGSRVFTYSRYQWWLPTMLAFAAGYALTAQAFDSTFVLGLMYFSFPYSLLRFGANDIFDSLLSQQTTRRIDARHALLSREALPGAIFWVLLTQLLVLGPFLLQASSAARLWTIALLVASLAYSAPYVRFKETPVFDLVSFASFIAGPFVAAQLLVGDTISYSLMAAILLWGMATYLFGSTQDIDIDRLGWIRSTARVLGLRGTILLSTVSYLASAALVWVSFTGNLSWLALLPLTYAANTARFGGVSNPELISVGWRILLRLNVLVCLLLAAILILAR